MAAWTGEEAKGKGAKTSIEPALPVEHCRLMSRLTSQWPVVVQEYFWIDRENGRVEIEDHFTYRIIGSGWGTTVEAFAPIPPVVSLARDMGMAVTTDGNTRIDDAGYPTKYGPLRFVPNSAVSRWQIPLPPEHTLSFVGTTTPDPDWRWAVDHQIDLWTTEQNFWWPCSYGFGPLNQIGLYSTLGMAAPDLRARFLDRAREVIDLRARNEGFVRFRDVAAGNLDPYAFTRASYLQHRQSEIYDGNPPRPKFELFEEAVAEPRVVEAEPDPASRQQE